MFSGSPFSCLFLVPHPFWVSEHASSKLENHEHLLDSISICWISGGILSQSSLAVDTSPLKQLKGLPVYPGFQPQAFPPAPMLQASPPSGPSAAAAPPLRPQRSGTTPQRCVGSAVPPADGCWWLTWLRHPPPQDLGYEGVPRGPKGMAGFVGKPLWLGGVGILGILLRDVADS